MREPVVVEPDTFTFCKNVAFVFVLMLSVLATPVKFVPSPVKLVAVIIPALAFWNVISSVDFNITLPPLP